MKTRFFSFGCSYTHFNTLTWADYLGENFDEYYNFGRGGASNTFIMNRLVEANEHFVFDSKSDLVVVMLTGFNRFSWINDLKNLPTWETCGDLYLNLHLNKDYAYTKDFLENMWSGKMAVYMSWIATKVIKLILKSNNINHKILMSLDNKTYIENHNLFSIDSIGVNYVNDIYNTLDSKESFEEFRKRKQFDTQEHPSPDQHFNFAYEHFPELMTKLPKKTIKPIERNSINLCYYG